MTTAFRRTAFCFLVALAGFAVVRPLADLATAGDTSLRERVEAVITRSGAEVAVAYRPLDGRDELFIRADDPFHAASTMKVPVMIELFRQARSGHLRLDDEIPVVNTFHSIVGGSPYALDVGDDSDADMYHHLGGRMSYRALCEAMITVSSNFAANLLIEKLGAPNIQKTTNDLGATGMRVRRGVEDQKAFDAGLSNETTARALQILLTKIANGDAVDTAASREMIAVLKRQHFNEAIPAGLPPGIAVAHKTGEITRIHHDAAIVYAARPFVLVVLVRGLQDQKQSAAVMAEIARLAYEADMHR